MGHKDNLVDIPKTKAWAEFCKAHCAAKSWYALENVLEKDAFSRDKNNNICHSGKWAAYYSKGEHVPQKRLWMHVEKCLAGSAAILNHPLWRITKLSPEKAAKVADKYFGELPPEICQKIFRQDAEGRLVRKYVTGKTLEFLEMQHNLDGLAALSLIALEARGRDKKELVQNTELALFRVLLRLPFMGAPWLALVAEDLFELLKRRVFRPTSNQIEQVCLEEINYFQVTQLIQFTCEHVTKSKPHISQEVFFERLFGIGWLTPLGYLVFWAPIKLFKYRKGKIEVGNHDDVITCWMEAFSKLELLRNVPESSPNTGKNVNSPPM